MTFYEAFDKYIVDPLKLKGTSALVPEVKKGLNAIIPGNDVYDSGWKLATGKDAAVVA